MKQSMKKIKIPVLLIFSLFFFLSCKQSATIQPLFSATGYWRDQSTLESVGILNRPDGTSRLYILTNNDTAFAMHTYDGTYSVHGNTFRFQSFNCGDGAVIYMETKRNLSGSMSGFMVTRLYPEKERGLSFSHK
jgi:hypothetical protein